MHRGRLPGPFYLILRENPRKALFEANPGPAFWFEHENLIRGFLCDIVIAAENIDIPVYGLAAHRGQPIWTERRITNPGNLCPLT